MDKPAPTFTPLADFLYDTQRSLQYFKDHRAMSIRPCRASSSRALQALSSPKRLTRYKRRLMQLGGKPFRGRPRKIVPTAAE